MHKIVFLVIYKFINQICSVLTSAWVYGYGKYINKYVSNLKMFCNMCLTLLWSSSVHCHGETKHKAHKFMIKIIDEAPWSNDGIARGVGVKWAVYLCDWFSF